MEWILIGGFAAIFAFIVILYLINSKKINKNSQKAEKKSASNSKSDIQAKTSDDKVEVESNISKKTAIEQALEEENSKQAQYEMEKAFEMIEAERQKFEKAKTEKHGKLEVDRSDYKSEIEIALEDGNFVKSRNHLKSETAQIGKEGPSQEQIDRVNAEIEKEQNPQNIDTKSISKQIANLSPELKAVLLNDILNKKY